ncbi:MAG: D-(-)-3-hydroxybutyrate oligomer hydrolase [Rhodocyclaceae bacterium]|nr:D-(-)-3-hydroxybutyrate oligomer hydrolase [Rhodocyclaceae bacterium]MBX3667677.1 D-(-)-3-hydroxybutyrate oligomer hydrolase [Rhodocyclaceae bacterium]
MQRNLVFKIALLAAAGLSASAIAEDLKAPPVRAPNLKPAFLGTVVSQYYDGSSDDLLTAGLGWAGLQAAFPLPLSPAPTAAELRRRAIHTNYRAVLDFSSAGGFGTLYGPNVALDGTVDPTPTAGKIAGTEYRAFADDGSGRKNVTLLVQVPDSFDPDHACIVTATSSGSRGVYGAIGASGEWGLKRGCAVAYTDKGSGNGLHDLMNNQVGLIDGTRTGAATAGTASHFTAALNAGQLASFNAAYPNRVAFKHAHSQQNPERDWGRNTLQAIVFAFYALNDRYGTPVAHGPKRVVLDRRNTLVIASGISNGGGAALAAAEMDNHQLIDGVAVTEPQIQVRATRELVIQQGATTMTTVGRSLYDYFTYANLYQPCAALSTRAAGSPAAGFLLFPNPVGPTARCAALQAKGLLTATTLADQAEEALDKLHAYGWLADSDRLHASHYRFATNAIAVTYSNTYGRFSVADNLCGFSMANTDGTGAPAPQNPLLQANIFATGNGVPPTSGVNIVYNLASGGPKLDFLAVSPSSGAADFALDGAICQRNLALGQDILTGAPLSGAMAAASKRIRRGIAEAQVGGNVQHTPTIVVQGRADALVPVNQASRAWYGVNLLSAPKAANVSYVEVTNAQHFDAFLPATVLPGYDSLYVPLHIYLIRALDAMYAHLTSGAPLPPSQVVRTIPRGGAPGAAPPLTAANVPPISASPAVGDAIQFHHHTLQIPD